MMQIVLGLALLVLAGAVVLLFAMFGELASRLPRRDSGASDTRVQLLDGALIGRVTNTWPASLSELAVAESAVLLVLSTACASCQQVAKQLSAELIRNGADDIAVLISCGTQDSGEDFVQQHGLSGIPYFIDKGGDWVKNEFGVTMSPTGLIFRKGRLDSALLFQDLVALRAAAVKAPLAERQGD
jgi:hypothetical protein